MRLKREIPTSIIIGASYIIDQRILIDQRVTFLIVNQRFCLLLLRADQDNRFKNARSRLFSQTKQATKFNIRERDDKSGFEEFLLSFAEREDFRNRELGYKMSVIVERESMTWPGLFAKILQVLEEVKEEENEEKLKYELELYLRVNSLLLIASGVT